jgi:hypothetical protein
MKTFLDDVLELEDHDRALALAVRDQNLRLLELAERMAPDTPPESRLEAIETIFERLLDSLDASVAADTLDFAADDDDDADDDEDDEDDLDDIDLGDEDEAGAADRRYTRDPAPLRVRSGLAWIPE